MDYIEGSARQIFATYLQRICEGKEDPNNLDVIFSIVRAQLDEWKGNFPLCQGLIDDVRYNYENVLAKYGTSQISEQLSQFISGIEKEYLKLS